MCVCACAPVDLFPSLCCWAGWRVCVCVCTCVCVCVHEYISCTHGVHTCVHSVCACLQMHFNDSYFVVNELLFVFCTTNDLCAEPVDTESRPSQAAHGHFRGRTRCKSALHERTEQQQKHTCSRDALHDTRTLTSTTLPKLSPNKPCVHRDQETKY